MAIFTNQATLSYNNTVTNSNIATGELLEVLSATKTAVMNGYVQNDNISYIISITNTGTTAFTNLSISDNLGAYSFGTGLLYPLTYTPDSVRYYINGVLQPVPAVTETQPLVITGINVPAAGNAIIVYETRANQYAPLGVNDSITNEAIITEEGLSTPVTVSETVSTEDRAELTITKAITPATVTENGQITYTFIIQNSGNTAADAGDNVFITDTFAPILSSLTVEFNGTAWTEETNYIYDETTGVFSTVQGQITVPAATYQRDPDNGNWIINPGVSILTVTGTI